MSTVTPTKRERVTGAARRLARLTLAFADATPLTFKFIRSAETDAAEKAYVALHAEWKQALEKYRKEKP